jgi:hypothetical protein
MTLLLSTFGFAGVGGLFGAGRPRANNGGGRQNKRHRLRRTDSFELHRSRLQTRHNSLTNGHTIDPAPGAALCAVLPRQDSITLNKRRLESMEHVWDSLLDKSHDDVIEQ